MPPDLNQTAEEIFLEYSAQKLEQLAGRIETCLELLTDAQVWARGGNNENSVANLVLHLSGNVRQWILSGVGGDTDIRVRNDEFAAQAGPGCDELCDRLLQTVSEAVAVIRAIPPSRLAEPLAVQGYSIHVLTAIYSVVEHFAQHTGQIIFATKMMSGEDLGFHAYLKEPHTGETP